MNSCTCSAPIPLPPCRCFDGTWHPFHLVCEAEWELGCTLGAPGSADHDRLFWRAVLVVVARSCGALHPHVERRALESTPVVGRGRPTGVPRPRSSPAPHPGAAPAPRHTRASRPCVLRSMLGGSAAARRGGQ